MKSNSNFESFLQRTFYCGLMALALSIWPKSTVMHAAGIVTGWGGNVSGQLNVPPGLEPATIAGGGWHSLALKTEGTVAAWGYNCCGQTAVPAGLSNVVAIAGGRTFSLALKMDGTLAAWGENGSGQLNNLDTISNVVAISAGMYHGLALKSDATVTGWGSMTAPGLSNVVQISASDSGGMALKADGTVAVWGGSPVPPFDLSNVVSIAAGASHSLAIRADGSAVAWGYNCCGQTNFPADLTNAIAVAGANNHSLALRADGTVVARGANSYGEGTVPPDLSSVAAIAAGYTHNLAITNGQALQIVQPPLGGTANAGMSFLFVSGAVGVLTNQWKFNGTNLPGANGAMLLLTNVQPEQAGFYSVEVSDAHGSLESFPVMLSTVPLTIDAQPTNQTVYSGETATFSIMTVGAGPFSYRWFYNGAELMDATNLTLVLTNLAAGQSGNYSIVVSNDYGAVTSSIAVLTVVSAKPIITTQPQSRGTYAGKSVTFQVVADGSKPLSYQWRFNGADIADATSTSLMLTNLSSTNAGLYSVRVSNPAGFTVSSNAQLTFLAVVTWGATNSYGLGNIPMELTNVLAISAGGAHSVALKPNGTVAAWGYNFFNQTNVPANLSNVVAISAGGNHTLALKTNGTVVSWGNLTNVPSYVTNIVAIAAGSAHSMALRSDGIVLAWGSGNVTNVPANLSNVVAIAAGGSFGVALKRDGKVTAWATSASTTAMTNVTAISASEFAFIALKTNGTALASIGASSASNFVAVSAGRYHNIGLKSDGTITNWPGSGPAIPVGLTNVAIIASGQEHGLAILGPLPPPVPPLANLKRTTNSFSFSFPTQSGKIYAVDFSDSLSNTNWISLPLVAGTGGTLALTNSPATNSQRFYRVRGW